MQLIVKPVHSLKGAIDLPASKSYSIRAFFIAACGGVSTIIAPSNCDDAQVASELSQALGCRITRHGNSFIVKAAQTVVTSRTYSVNESGTSLRFLLPLLSLHAKSARVVGRKTLIGRPNKHLCAALRQCGMDIQGDGDRESVPIVYKGGALRGGDIAIDGSLSSQFISALLITLPRLAVNSRIEVTGKDVVSADYVIMTRQILSLAGIKIQAKGQRTFVIKGKQVFKGLKNFCVPSDYGLAAFTMAAAALIPSEVVLRGHFNDKLIQSDGHILTFLKTMGVRFDRSSQAIRMKGPFDLKGGTFSLKTCPDLVPIMAVLALFAKGPTRLIDIHHARAKESDRISDLRMELLKVGADVRESSGALTIHPLPKYKSGKVLDAHHDHRLAMAFTVLGLKLGCRVNGIESSHKSYPDFIADMQRLKALPVPKTK